MRMEHLTGAYLLTAALRTGGHFQKVMTVDMRMMQGRIARTTIGEHRPNGARTHAFANLRSPTQNPNCIYLVTSVCFPLTLTHPCHDADARRRSGHALSRSSLVMNIREPTTSIRSGLRFVPSHGVRMLHLISLTLCTEAELLFSARSQVTVAE